MIKIQDSVPSIYYNSSRDFQFIGHLFDLVLNAIKTDADLLFNLPLSTNSDDQLLELMAYTFGLQLDKTKYTSKQLRALCSIAPQMMRAKGSEKAVELLCTALMHADGLEDLYTLTISPDRTELTISLSSLATCKEIILEILPYILPAGMVFNIVSTGMNKTRAHSQLVLQDSVRVQNFKWPEQEVAVSKLPGLSKLPASASSGIFNSAGALDSNLATNVVLSNPENIKASSITT
jgi:hypothetical protein